MPMPKPVRILLQVLGVGLILAIVGAVILPNILEVRGTRHPVSRIKNDMRSMATGLETYFIDNLVYPRGVPLRHFAQNPGVLEKVGGDGLTVPGGMTTPIAYLTSYFSDPYSPGKNLPFAYFSDGESWILFSPGPDLDYDLRSPEGVFTSEEDQPSTRILLLAYDPTNGATSSGDVWRVKQ